MSLPLYPRTKHLFMVEFNKSPKLIIKLIVNDNATLIPLYFIVGSIILSTIFRYYEINDNTGFYENAILSTSLLFFSIIGIPVFIVLCIYRVNKLISFFERGKRINGKVVELKRSSVMSSLT